MLFPYLCVSVGSRSVVLSSRCLPDLTLYGLELGLLTMKKGEFSRFLFLPKYAYGEFGCPPLIPPSATVLYEVQILDYLDSAEVDEFFALTPVSMLWNV